MADDLLGGVLGGDDEQPETEAPQALAGAEAFATAVASRLSANDPAVARETVAFLGEQTRLLETQRRHLEDEHVSRLTQLRLTVAAAKRKRYADYMRNGFYTCIALLALGVLLAAIRMTVEAMSDHSLVVADFTVPADFAARGITSQALAEDLASRLAAIRATVNSSSLAPANDVRADQTDVLKVQIPETGISIDQLERFLHRWLGHQTVVNGQLSEEAGGQISIRLHVAGADPIVVTGASADFNRLLQTTAEQAFEIYDPDNYAIYLWDTGRRSEGLEAMERLVHSPRMATFSKGYRAGTYALWAGGIPDRRQGLSIALVGRDIDPRTMMPWSAAGNLSGLLGHDQAALDFERKAVGTERRDQPPEIMGSYRWVVAAARVHLDRLTRDFAALDHDEEIEDQARPQDAHVRYSNSAEVAAALHDEGSSHRDLARAIAVGPVDSNVLEARWSVSSAAGDWAQALDAAKALVAAEEAQKSAALKSDPQHPEFAASYDLALATQYDPLLAYAEAMTGDTASATALISQTPTDCYLCVSTRAKIAALAGDAATADRWFAEAVRQAPDLPTAYYEWGEALLTRGDLAGAIAKLQAANQRGPHWADPLKAWGDVLAKQGHWKDALAKYDEALKYAPNWAALRQARGTAAVKTKG